MPVPFADHLVFRASGTSDNAIAQFEEMGFQIHFGGQHTDGITSNSLVVLADGVYLEIVSFNESAPGAKEHGWSAKSTGWIDWDITPPTDSYLYVQAVNESHAAANAADANLFQQPIRGGRLTAGPQPKKLEWLMTFPVADRGKLPVLCEDVSERASRVRMDRTKHPNGVVGLASITLIAKPGGFENYQDELTHLFGAPKSSTATSAVFPLATPEGIYSCHMVLQAARSPEEMDFVVRQGEGLYSVELRTESGEEVSLDAINIRIVNS